MINVIEKSCRCCSLSESRSSSEKLRPRLVEVVGIEAHVKKVTALRCPALERVRCGLYGFEGCLDIWIRYRDLCGSQFTYPKVDGANLLRTKLEREAL